MGSPPVRSSYAELWRSLTMCQQIAVIELWEQGVHHGNWRRFVVGLRRPSMSS